MLLEITCWLTLGIKGMKPNQWNTTVTQYEYKVQYPYCQSLLFRNFLLCINLHSSPPSPTHPFTFPNSKIGSGKAQILNTFAILVLTLTIRKRIFCLLLASLKKSLVRSKLGRYLLCRLCHVLAVGHHFGIQSSWSVCYHNW